MRKVEEKTYFQQTYIDPIIGGLKVGVSGSLKYILDSEGKAISKGYHNFWMHKGTLMGGCGRREERVTFNLTNGG